MGFNYGPCPQCGHDGDAKVHPTTDKDSGQVWIKHLCEGCGHIFSNSTHMEPPGVFQSIHDGFFRIIGELIILFFAALSYLFLGFLYSLYFKEGHMAAILAVSTIAAFYLYRVLKALAKPVQV